jgi:hypothetical protein
MTIGLSAKNISTAVLLNYNPSLEAAKQKFDT